MERFCRIFRDLSENSDSNCTFLRECAKVSAQAKSGNRSLCLESLLDFRRARVYADRQGWYASNETCIDWQAALVFLLAGELN
jgi:hypothetical protein